MKGKGKSIIADVLIIIGVSGTVTSAIIGLANPLAYISWGTFTLIGIALREQ